MTISASQARMRTRAFDQPFDSIAPDYDRLFTHSEVGKVQRTQVARQFERCFAPGSHVLELNCGTGEDAISLARRGVKVSAYDASMEMIRIANQKLRNESHPLEVKFSILQNESLTLLGETYDGALSNFGGLNCSMDWECVADGLARLVRPGGHVLLCVLGRLCLWEMLYYLLRGRLDKALRRTRKGASIACVDGRFLKVVYPSVHQIEQCFSSGFRLREWRGVGVFVPPSYCESIFSQRRRVLGLLALLDSKFGHLPGVRCWGDHVLLDFVRLPA